MVSGNAYLRSKIIKHTKIRKLYRATFVAFLVMSASAGVAAALTLSENGTASCVIVSSPDATPPQRHAARELGRFLHQVTGGDFEVVNHLSKGQSHLLVGIGAAKLVDSSFSVEGLADEGIVIRTAGDNLIIAGGEPRGTLYAVYTFLEDYVGCHWWTPSASTIPHKATLALSDIDVRYKPALEYRCSNSVDVTDADYSVRNKFNGFSHSLDSARGGKKHTFIAAAKWSCHTFWTLVPPELYFESHPEWYSLINGERTHKAPHYHASSLCLTNEQMRKKLVENQKLALCWNPHATLVSISQVDDGGPPERCECEQCRAMEARGNASDLLIWFVNSVAEELADEYPNIDIDTLAYHYTQAPPKYMKPRPGIIVRLCSIRCSFSVPFSHDRNKEFRDDLIGWSKVCDRLYVWDYVVNFSHRLLPHPNLRVLGPNVRFLVDHNVKGVFAESNNGVAPLGDFRALRFWMLGKLYWNPELDSQELIETFCEGYYGAAGNDVVAYLDVIHDAVEAAGDKLGLSSPSDAEFLSFDTLSRAWGCLRRAEKAVSDLPEMQRRVQELQLAVLYPVMLNWDQMRDAAKASAKTWPWSDSLTDVMHQSQQIALRLGWSGLFAQMPMSPAMQQAMQH